MKAINMKRPAAMVAAAMVLGLILTSGILSAQQRHMLNESERHQFKLAKQLYTKGQQLFVKKKFRKARRAFEMGLVNDVWPENQLLDKATALAAMMARQPAFSANLIKTAVKKGMDMELSAALDYEARCFEILFSTHDQKEGTAAFVEKRKPDFKGY